MKPLYGRGLPRCAFLDHAQNVLMIGGPDAGKTHLATALEVQVIRHCHRRVRFLSTLGLVNTLEQGKRDPARPLDEQADTDRPGYPQ